MRWCLPVMGAGSCLFAVHLFFYFLHELQRKLQKSCTHLMPCLISGKKICEFVQCTQTTSCFEIMTQKPECCNLACSDRFLNLYCSSKFKEAFITFHVQRQIPVYIQDCKDVFLLTWSWTFCFVQLSLVFHIFKSMIAFSLFFIDFAWPL